MLEKYLDHSSSKTVRKSVLTVALFTIFIANIKFGSNSIKILGLELILDKYRLVAFGQISSLFLLIVFFFRAVPEFFNSIKEISLNRLKRYEDQENENYSDRWHGGVEFATIDGGGPQDEARELDAKFAYFRAKIERRYSTLTFSASVMAVLVVDYGAPFLVGMMASFHPYSVSKIIDMKVKYEVSDMSSTSANAKNGQSQIETKADAKKSSN